MKSLRNLLVFVTVLMLLTGAAANASAEQPPQVPLNQALVLAGGESSNPREYDPATTHGTGDKLVFSGLVAFDPRLNLIPDLAGNWEINSAATVYTFHLRQNARFHNGRTVTAQDVIYSWERAAAAGTHSDTVLSYLGDILGVKEMHAGTANSISGVKALDEHTLQVTIDGPKPFFLLKLTYPTGFVVDKANVSSGRDWYRQPNGTGPYKLVQWIANQKIVYQANPDFYLGQPGLPYVVINLNTGGGTALYETGKIDLTGVSLYSADRFLDPREPLNRELHTGVDLCTSYILFDTTRPPFDDVKVRQAFTMAFDRQKYIDVVMHGHALPAIGLYPPALPGFDTALKGLSFDPTRARQLLAASRFGGPAGLPAIVYTGDGYGSSISPEAAALAQMWKQYLGVTITIENIEPNFYSDEIFSGHHGQLLGYGWCADYPDPENFADVLFHTGAQQNIGGYSNTELDKLLEAARVEQDLTKRIHLYQQAEKVIVSDAAVLFTVHSLSYTLVKPYVKGFVTTPIAISLERFMWLEGK